VTLAQPVPRPDDHRRLTVLSAAAAVLCVLTLPSLVVAVSDLTRPPEPPRFTLTEKAERAARIPTAAVLNDSVIVFLTPESGAPVMASGNRVPTGRVADQLVPLGVSILLPMTPATAPAGTRDLAGTLSREDNVKSNLGPMVAGCLVRTDRTLPCVPTLLTRHPGGYYRIPGTWGSPAFLDRGSGLEAEQFEVLGGWVLVGGAPGTSTDRVEVTLTGGARITAFGSGAVSPGNTVWWAALPRRAISATAYDAQGRTLSGWTTR
jgi:hypothetical protein